MIDHGPAAVYRCRLVSGSKDSALTGYARGSPHRLHTHELFFAASTGC
jgi:hypothetical protein